MRSFARLFTGDVLGWNVDVTGFRGANDVLACNVTEVLISFATFVSYPTTYTGGVPFEIWYSFNREQAMTSFDT